MDAEQSFQAVQHVAPRHQPAEEIERSLLIQRFHQNLEWRAPPFVAEIIEAGGALGGLDQLIGVERDEVADIHMPAFVIEGGKPFRTRRRKPGDLVIGHGVRFAWGPIAGSKGPDRLSTL